MSTRAVIVGTAGHIDHGKSSVVRALTGTDPDRLKEEQERGITIDLGFAHLQTPEVSLAFVDVPGHERFVKNMLAGAAGIDLVMLVVAADESVMPQTREHFDICRLLQIPAGVIVLTKTDNADAEMQELATLEVRELVAGSFLDDAPLVPVSARTGAGMSELTEALVRAAVKAPPRRVDRPARLPIDRAFTVKGFGTVVTGTLVAGALSEGDALTVLPRGLPAVARGLHVHGAAQAHARAGQRVAINLGGVELSEVSRGDTVAAPGSIQGTHRFDVMLDLLRSSPLRHGARVRFHQGTIEVVGRISIAGAPASSGTWSQENAIPPGAKGYARLRLDSAAIITRGDRFILRSYSPVTTIGGGVVLDPQPPRAGVRNEATRRRFQGLDSDDDAQVVTRIVAEGGAAGIARNALISRLGLATTIAAETVDRLLTAGAIVALDDLLLAPEAIEDLTSRLMAAVDAHHARHPLDEGLPREEARERLFRGLPRVFDLVVSRLAAQGRLVARERLARTGHQVALTAEESGAYAAIDAMLKAAGLTPPETSSIPTRASLCPELADRVIRLLIKRGQLVRVESLLFHVDALRQLKSDVQARKGDAGGAIDIGTFKERYGLSRKFAIPLLEYLDRERVTRRVGNGRVVI
jgi:selenocysteine-specific elongation factor